jgi:hypothetical protein
MFTRQMVRDGRTAVSIERQTVRRHARYPFGAKLQAVHGNTVSIRANQIEPLLHSVLLFP